MAEVREERSTLSSPPEDAMSADALYNQGMAYYRRRQWQKARESFLRLKKLDPGRRGIDALLDELEIFIRLDSIEPAELTAEQPLAEAATATQTTTQPALSRGIEHPITRGRSWPTWIVPLVVIALLGVAVFAVYIYRASTNTDQEIQALLNKATSYRVAKKWTPMIDTYNTLLLMQPKDQAVIQEVTNGLWNGYYERANQSMKEAEALEAAGKFAEASQKWDNAIADLAEADKTDASHLKGSYGTIAALTDTAQKHKGWATLFAEASQLLQDKRWPEAVQKLQALRAQAPDYRSSDVRNYFAEAYLQAGEDAIAKADTPAQVQGGLDQLNLAFQALPSSAKVQAAQQHGRAYLQAMTQLADKKLDEALKTLEPVLKDAPDFAQGRAREMACQIHDQLAQAAYAQGNLAQALAEYQAVIDLKACSQQAQLQPTIDAIHLAQTPTVTPTPSPTRTPLPTRPPTATPRPTQTPVPSPVPPTQAPTNQPPPQPTPTNPRD